MRTISVEGITAKRKLFHDEWVNVYPTDLPFSEISFWPENARTLFTFERLERQENKSLGELSLDTITTFIAEEPIHKLDLLAKSIALNGVQIPLIISDDYRLLDGNRRYFACAWIKMEAERKKLPLPEILMHIPVLVVKRNDLKSPLIELKIIAEANFVTDLKVPWPLDAQARAVYAFYTSLEGKSKEHRIDEASKVFGISRATILVYLETLELTKEFIDEGTNSEDKIVRRRIIEDKFVYFWEFLNKGIKGRSGFGDDPKGLAEIKKVFFDYVGMGKDSPIRNLKQIEPLIQAKRDETAWAMLNESKGANLSLVVTLMNERKEYRKADDKVRLFIAWLKDVQELTPSAKNNLAKLSELALQKSK